MHREGIGRERVKGKCRREHRDQSMIWLWCWEETPLERNRRRNANAQEFEYLRTHIKGALL